MELPKVSKKAIVTGVAILALGGAGLLLYLNTRDSYDGTAWVDSNWMYRRTISVANSGSSLTNEDVLVTIDTASLISNNKLQSNCEDIRFTDSDDGSYLDYWIEDDCNTTNTKIWVRIPSLPSGGKNIYVYYGNSVASAGSLSWDGDIYMYADGSCPSGWTQASGMNDKFLYGSDTFGSTGGSDTHTHDDVSCSSTSISTTPVAAAAPYTIHTFTSSGTFVVNEEITAEVLVVAGGGGGGGRSNGQGAGGGGGGVIYNSSYTFAAGSYPVSVGAGGAAGVNANRGGNGDNSSVGTLTAIGGGGGGSSGAAATGGGSGGGGSKTYPTPGSGTSGQGNSGGAGYKDCNMGGGGGAGSAGTTGSTNTSQCWLSTPGSGGNAYASSITGVTKYYGGGGGAADVGYSYTKKRGVGKGGGGYGGYNSVLGSTGTPNTGGGGGGGGGAGGSGIVIIRYASGGKATGGTATPVQASSPSTVHTHATMSNTVDSASNVPSNRSMLLCSRKKFTFPTGSIAQFATMPSTGWTRYSNLDDVFPRVANTSGVTGGSSTHAHNLTAVNTSGALGEIVGMGHFSGSGGTVTTSGSNKIHTFTSSGTFTATGNGVAEVLVVAGGGGGGNTGSGGGAGGFLNDLVFEINAGTYEVTVGAGGTGGASTGAGGANGENSVFSSLTAIGGGGGRTHGGTTGASGGSGSGAPLRSTTPAAVGGAGTTGQGNAGGAGGVQTNNWIAANAGGGGAGSVGGGCPIATEVAGTGGQGLPSWITGSEQYYAGGGFGGEVNQGGADSTGGIGGGGIAVRDGAGGDGTANTGGGGGGGSYAGGTYMNGGAGGSGIVVISYIASDPVSVSGQNHVHTTNSSSSNSSSNLPPYKKLLFGLANSDSYVTSEYILITSENPPLGYNRYTDLDNRFAIGSSVFGETGGSSSHSHTMNISTGASSSSMILALGTGITLADASHTHSCTATSPSASSLPSYYSVIYTQRKESKEVIISKETTESSPPPSGSDSWVDSDWLYKRPINIENSGSGVVYEDVLITVDTASLISSGKLQSNCEDLRFEDSDYSGFLSYWIEDDCNTSNTKIWVRIPNLPSGGKNIYMYYGNSSAPAGTLPWGGTIYMYSDSSCPEGWTQATAMNDKFLYGSYTFGNTGGSDTHTHGSASCTSNTSTGTTGVYSSSGDVLGSGAEHTHTLNTGFSSSSNVPPYKGMVLCYRKKFTFSAGLISIFAGNSPTGYTRFTGLDDYFPRVMSSYGGTGGSSTHTHGGVAATSSEPSATQATTTIPSQQATGGTITTVGNDNVHTFTSSGTFTAPVDLTARVLVVAGGGGGGYDRGGGGGAGGMIENTSLSISSGSYSVSVGAGGAQQVNGQNSSFGTYITTQGGGAGGSYPSTNASSGGSGGGGASVTGYTTGANGTAGQGNAGGSGNGGSPYPAGGGGGAGSVGTTSNGGNGKASDITGTSVIYAGGGGGRTGDGTTGGGGDGGKNHGDIGQPGTNGLGGGGGGGAGVAGGSGGSGIVIIRYTTAPATTVASSAHTHVSIADSVSSASSLPPIQRNSFW
jgi:hypothetical protein